MEFTASLDGVYRCTVRGHFRLTQEEMEDYCKIAYQHGYDTVEDYFDSQIWDLFESMHLGEHGVTL